VRRRRDEHKGQEQELKRVFELIPHVDTVIMCTILVISICKI